MLHFYLRRLALSSYARTVLGLVSVVLLGTLAVAGSGCSRDSKVEARTTTVGQELQDLDAARSKGLLTEEEYNKQRKEIMKRD